MRFRKPAFVRVSDLPSLIGKVVAFEVCASEALTSFMFSELTSGVSFAAECFASEALLPN